MKNNQPVTQQEIPLSDSDAIISTTDLKGVIRSINQDFLRIAGFPEEDLVGQSHNIIRHPDMPVEAFKDLWDTLKEKKPWMGLVKNRCKNGDHYYVDAYVTPVYEGHDVIGYQSVRFRPERSVVDRAERFYAAIRDQKTNLLQRLKLANFSFRVKAWLVAGLVALPAAVWAIYSASQALAVLALVTFMMTSLLSFLLIKPLLDLAERSTKWFDNPIAKFVYTGRNDEVGQLEVALKAFRSQNRTILGRIENSASELSQVTAETNNIIKETTQGVKQQQAEVEQMAAAMNQMAIAVAEVARNAENTAATSSEVLSKTEDGEQLVNNAVLYITQLSTTVSEATAVIEKLREDSQNIGSVVDVISNIADETNLLALNAAIEAARAGEQGRGFAVVADEVRNLANNTQQSTNEIQAMIKELQQSSSEAVDAMGEGRKRADHSVEKTEQVGTAFREISASIDNISAMNTQVATASEQQSAVAEEINRNVEAINDVAHSTLDNANNTAKASGRLAKLVQGLHSMVKQFGEV